MTNFAQFFCTVADLVADAQSPGTDEARMFQAIREASDHLQKKIGWFIPVTLTRSFHGKGSKKLFVPPLLAISSIVNDDDSLTTLDYILKPDDGFWPNGPYGRIEVHPEATLLCCWFDQQNGVVITGRWGKYERSGDTGATVQDSAQQSSSQATLKVSDGGKVSPGMVLLIESEQQLVTGWSTPTTAVTQLNGAIASTGDIVTVDNGALVNLGEIIRVGFEQMQVRDRQTHQLSVARGWNNTAIVSHLDDTAVDVYRTVTVSRGVNGTAAAAHALNTAISRYFAPDDIQYLCKEIATLIVNKAKGGYQGRTGNDQTGVVFYNDAFPQFDIKQIRERYSIARIS